MTADSVVLSWEDPGSNVTKYIIEKTDGNDVLIEAIPVDGSMCETTVGGLSAGSEYKLRLFAENEAGRSELPAVVPVVGKPAEELGTGACHFIVSLLVLLPFNPCRVEGHITHCVQTSR